MHEIFIKGGPLMYVLAGLSVWALAIFLFKIWFCIRNQVWQSTFIRQAEEALRQGKLKDWFRDGLKLRNPLFVFVRKILEKQQRSRVTPLEVQLIGDSIIGKLESFNKSLAVLVQLAPLVGLLGTVFGIIIAFQGIQQAGGVLSPLDLAGGIWQALITTAFGLIIAIIAMATLALSEASAERYRRLFNHFGNSFFTEEFTLVTEERKQHAGNS